MDLLMELRLLIEKLRRDHLEYALCGGLAMSVYALPRATLDIDLLIKADSLDRVIRAAAELGYTMQAAPMEFKEGKIQIHRVSKQIKDSEESIPLDLLIVTPALKEVWDGRDEIEWEYGTISVVSPEGLIRLKSMRGSGLDQDDIRYLEGILNEN